jgi:hypothetical protein
MSNDPGPEAVNPYAAPQSLAAIDNRDADSARSYELYSVRAILLATFLGSTLAGGILMAIDYRRLMKSGAARNCVVIAILAQVPIFGLIFMLPDNVPAALVAVPQLVAMYYIANGLLGSALRAHQQAGGQEASLWKAAGIGVLGGIVVFCTVFAIIILLAAVDVDLLPIEE